MVAAAAAAATEKAEVAPGVPKDAGGLLLLLLAVVAVAAVIAAVVVAAAVAVVVVAAAVHPQKRDRDTWGLHPGPPPLNHGSAQKCPSWGWAGWPAPQSPPQSHPFGSKDDVLRESQASKLPHQRLSGSSPLSLSDSLLFSSLGLPWSPDLSLKNVLHRARREGREGAWRQEGEKELSVCLSVCLWEVAL